MGLRLKELREAAHLSPRQMYERLGVKDSRYRKWESESAQIPLEYAIQCCSILHCTLDELMGRTVTPYTNDERYLVDLYRQCSTQGRKYVMQMAEVTAGVFGGA